MTAFTVFFLRLSDEQRNTLNNDGWDSGIGRAWMNAEGTVRRTDYSDVIEYDLFEKAAFIRNTHNLSSVWMAIQNHEISWKENESIVCYTNFPRSMMVGDIIYCPQDDSWNRVSRVGFEEIVDEYFIEYLRAKLSPKD